MPVSQFYREGSRLCVTPVLSLIQLSRSMMKHHLEQSTLAQRSEKEELQRLKKIASSIAKEVKHFWESVRKVVQY